MHGKSSSISSRRKPVFYFILDLENDQRANETKNNCTAAGCAARKSFRSVGGA
jgi:hypothetical protein